MTAGAPTKYKPEYVKQASNLCWLGATNEDLARSFEVVESTIDLWIKTHPKFSGAIKKARDDADLRVTKSLYQRAIGAKHKDTHVSNYQGEITLTEIVKHYPPETAAAAFWLKNRQPDKWREQTHNKHEHEFKAEMEEAARTLDEKLNATEPDDELPKNPE